MTPPATAAARRAAAGWAGAESRSAARPQRRVSGPARPTRPAPNRSARPVAVPRPARRASLPAWLRTLPDHRLLHRLIGGRIWIVLLGGLLVGIVTMQLTLLRLNAGIGRAVERSSQLEQRNAALRLSISELSDTSRIVGQATQMGYVMPPQGSPRFLTASATDAAKALTTMRVPDPNAAAVAAAELAASTEVAATTTVDPTVTAVDPITTAPDATTTTPDPTTTAPVTAAPTTSTDTTAPVAAAAPTTAAPVTATAGGASAPVGPQG